jgi:hypothetical protein
MEGRRRKAEGGRQHFPFIICLVSLGHLSVTIDDNSMTNDK